MFHNTSGMILWPAGGGGIFPIPRPDLQLSASWHGPHTLDIRLVDIAREDMQSGIATERQICFCGDPVALNDIFV